MFRRGAMRIPGLPPHDPYLEASRRHAAAMGQQSPYGRECFRIEDSISDNNHSLILTLTRLVCLALQQ